MCRYRFIFFITFFFSVVFLVEQACRATTPLFDKKSTVHTYQYLSRKQTDTNRHDNHQPHRIMKNDKKTNQMLTTTDKKQTTPWSNAFNFEKIWGTQVDPRTGILSAFVKAGSMVSNLGHGPDIDLEVSYNSSSIANPDGLGQGWSWNLTHFNVQTNQLVTSTGQNFWLQQNSLGQWQPLYHKLPDIRIEGGKSTHFIITYANGLRETLNNEGYETRLEQQDGRGVNFFYLPGSHQLRAVIDDQGNEITVFHRTGELLVVSRDTDGQPVTVRLNNSGNQLSDIILPLQDNGEKSAIHIAYASHLLIQTDYPTGLENKFEYNCKNAVRLPVPQKSPGSALCVVSRKTVIVDKNQKPMVVNYEYSKVNANGHNYLGFNAGLPIFMGSVKDILFDAPVSYTYRTQEDDGLIKEIRTYNKYHLLIDELKVSDHTNKILSETINIYCRTDVLNGCAYKSFKNLPVTYSLPLKMVTKVWGNISTLPAISTQTRSYDNLGRLISFTDNYGRTTKTTYCSQKGDASCPASPTGWLFSQLPETVTIYPAKTDTNTNAPPPVVTRNYYRKENNFSGNGYMLVLYRQVHQSDTQQITTTRDYYKDHSDALTYGLLKSVTTSGVPQKQTTLISVTKYYSYIENSSDHSMTTYTHISSNQHIFKRMSAVTISLFSDQIIQTTDSANKNITRYHYDCLNRLIQVDSAVGTPFIVSQYYQYFVSPAHNEVLITAPNGLQHKIIFDSAGRKQMGFDEMVSATGKAEPGKWLLKQQFIRDRYGRIIDEMTYIKAESDKTYPLTTTYSYDEMNVVNETHLPDGEIIVKRYDDYHHCMVSYKQDGEGLHSVVSVIHYNILDKPIRQIILPSSQTPLPSVDSLCATNVSQQNAKISVMTYDGFGRQITVTDPVGKVTSKHYDALGSVSEIVNPHGDKTDFIYNFTGHVIEKWVSPVTGGKYLLFSANYDATGKPLWKAGEDGKRVFYTYTTDGELSTITTATGHTISRQYNVIGLPVASYVDGQQTMSVHYDPVTALPTDKTDVTGTTTYTYSDDGILLQEIHSGKDNYPNYQLQWQYDQNRRLTSVTDIANNKTLTYYDALGRTAALFYQPSKGQEKLLYSPVYDNFSRTIKIHYGDGMWRRIHYDNYGHQQQVEDVMSDHKLSEWDYTYDKNDNIIQLNQQTEDSEKGILNYRYDELNNLVTMTCKGSVGLPLCPHDTATTGSGLQHAPIITQQNYRFTALNRLSQVQETLQDTVRQKTISKTVTYNYSKMSTPLRLQSILIQWNKDQPVTRNFSYDRAGNMVIDGEGNKMSYNAFNQITSVKHSDGRYSRYLYDGSNKEIMEKTPADMHYLFYRGKELINETIYKSGQSTHTTGYYGVARSIDGLIDQYYESNYKGDITGILIKDHSGQYKLVGRNIYSPYGMSWHHTLSSNSSYQKPLSGFDGERSDPVNGWQFLGAGHRTYNPQQRYFVSEDTAGDGYSFGSNNPVMNIDPDGNMPKWLGTIFKGAGYVTTFGLGAVHKKWANITSSVILAGLCLVSVGAMLETYGATLSVTAMAVTNVSLSAVPIAASCIPANRGFNIAAAVSGAVALATGVMYMLSPITANPSMLASKWLGKAATELGRDLINADRNIAMNISSQWPGDYLTIENDNQLNRAWKALRSVRPDANAEVGAALISTRVTGNPLNLQAVDEYINTLKIYPTLSNFKQRWSDLNEALGRLFAPFGRYMEVKNYYGLKLSRLNNRPGLIVHHNGGAAVLVRGNSDIWKMIRFNLIDDKLETKLFLSFPNYYVSGYVLF